MIALFTTKTKHHVFFENKIFNKYKKIITIYETRSIKPKFSIKTYFESQRELYEKKKYFKCKKFNFQSESFKVQNINSKQTLNILKKNNINFILVFGTRKISSKIVKKFNNKIFNLHGGNPEKYRGLDSHYWSIYHNDFNLSTCLHILNTKLDDGKIIFLKKIKLKKKMKIYKLRDLNTSNCIFMTLKLLKKLELKKKIKLTQQKNVGRYYSFMPSQLKKIIENKFNSFCKKNK